MCVCRGYDLNRSDYTLLKSWFRMKVDFLDDLPSFPAESEIHVLHSAVESGVEGACLAAVLSELERLGFGLSLSSHPCCIPFYDSQKRTIRLSSIVPKLYTPRLESK